MSLITLNINIVKQLIQKTDCHSGMLRKDPNECRLQGGLLSIQR